MRDWRRLLRTRLLSRVGRNQGMAGLLCHLKNLDSIPLKLVGNQETEVIDALGSPLWL